MRRVFPATLAAIVIATAAMLTEPPPLPSEPPAQAHSSAPPLSEEPLSAAQLLAAREARWKALSERDDVSLADIRRLVDVPASWRAPP